MIKVGLINGSVQQKNYTGYILNIIKEETILKQYEPLDIPLKDYKIPFPGEEIEKDDSEELRKILSSVDAYIIASPEYNGSFTAKLKLMIENSGYPSVMKNKPVVLVGLASGVLGAVKSLEQARTVFSHIGCLVLPRAISISKVETHFNESGLCINDSVLQEIKLSVKKLTEFVGGLKKI